MCTIKKKKKNLTKKSLKNILGARNENVIFKLTQYRLKIFKIFT